MAAVEREPSDAEAAVERATAEVELLVLDTNFKAAEVSATRFLASSLRPLPLLDTQRQRPRLAAPASILSGCAIHVLLRIMVFSFVSFAYLSVFSMRAARLLARTVLLCFSF